PDANAAGAAQPTMRIDSSNVASSYANTCYASSTKEEVVLNFGLNQSWERGQKDMQVQLTNRIILSPYAAKRLVLLLTAVIPPHAGAAAAQSPSRPPGHPARPPRREPARDPGTRPVRRAQAAPGEALARSRPRRSDRARQRLGHASHDVGPVAE